MSAPEAGADTEFPSVESDYPADVWKIALDKWNAMSDGERTAFREQKESESSSREAA